MVDLKDYNIEMWEPQKIKDFRRDLLAWYDENKRDLPWRQNQDAYRVWISEIMLQQTRVDTVIPYYERFLNWFPTIKNLANAPEEIQAMAGYITTADNDHDGIAEVIEKFFLSGGSGSVRERLF